LTDVAKVVFLSRVLRFDRTLFDEMLSVERQGTNFMIGSLVRFAQSAKSEWVSMSEGREALFVVTFAGEQECNRHGVWRSGSMPKAGRVTTALPEILRSQMPKASAVRLCKESLVSPEMLESVRNGLQVASSMPQTIFWFLDFDEGSGAVASLAS